MQKWEYKRCSLSDLNKYKSHGWIYNGVTMGFMGQIEFLIKRPLKD